MNGVDVSDEFACTPPRAHFVRAHGHVDVFGRMCACTFRTDVGAHDCVDVFGRAHACTASWDVSNRRVAR